MGVISLEVYFEKIGLYSNAEILPICVPRTLLHIMCGFRLI